MIEASIEIATARRDKEGVRVEISGWAFAEPGHIMTVQALGDGQPLGFIPYGFKRPDIAHHYAARGVSENVAFRGAVKLPGPLADAASLGVKLVFTSSSLHRRELAAAVTIPARELRTNPLPPCAPDPEHGHLAEAPLPTPAPPLPRLAAPNFFILGAAKCGTTSLYHALSQHPEIHLSVIKEPSFFSTGFQVVKNPVEYFNLFPEQPGKKRYGDASHVYFSTPEAAPVLRQLFPAAKFLLIVRNPVHRAHSLYQHMRRAGDEALPTFELALREEAHRFADPGFRTHCQQYFWNYMYCRTSMYDVQFRNYLDHFPREQFFVLTLGEWQADPTRWQSEIFRFLEVDPAVQVSAEPQNQAVNPTALHDDTRTLLEKHFTGMRERFEGLAGRRLQHWEY